MILLALVASTRAYAGEWRPVIADDDMVVFVDTASIVIDGSTRKALEWWIPKKWPQLIKRPITLRDLDMKSLTLFDCQNKTSGPILITMLDPSGKPISGRPRPALPVHTDPLAPDGPGSMLLKFVCLFDPNVVAPSGVDPKAYATATSPCRPGSDDRRGVGDI